MNFYRIRLPHSKQVLSGYSPLIKHVYTNDVSGFIFSEFGEYTDIMLIPAKPSAENCFSDDEALEWMKENDENCPISRCYLDLDDDNKDHYFTIAKRFIYCTSKWDQESPDAASGTSKIILSRVSRQDCKISPLDMFKSLCEAYPEACVFLFSTSEYGTWIGASPEPILEYHDGIASSLALAGTRWDLADESDWDVKNIEEQAIVTEFITSGFKKFGLQPTVEGPFTLTAGPVCHLATKITSKAQLPVLGLLKYLCPTPALSGYPRHKAISEISIWEFPNRRCYGGLIGVIYSGRNFYSYANLRSARIDTSASTIELRAGGGITHLSDPEKEWDETEKKLQTLRKFIE